MLIVSSNIFKIPSLYPAPFLELLQCIEKLSNGIVCRYILFQPTFDDFLKASHVGSFLTLIFQRKLPLEENNSLPELFVFGLVACKEFLFIEYNLLASFHEVSVM